MHRKNGFGFLRGVVEVILFCALVISGAGACVAFAANGFGFCAYAILVFVAAYRLARHLDVLKEEER